jgi:threonyl-tRNA synthetase
VEIPHITKKDLYVTSGHWEKYKDDLFRVTTREGHEFAMKPMNCPHHTQIYARRPWSYRELPQRYANTTMCYRDEQSGELSGLSRVRAFAQDDAHVFCRMSQVREEFVRIWDIVQEFYATFGFELHVRVSKHDPAHPEKYLGDKERWESAESVLEDIAKEKHADAKEGIGEAAFYGPKLDFIAKDAIGREWQVATIQLDMNMPERFDLVCVSERGEKERIVMIHAAIMGSIERFLSVLIEHTAGAFPFWLSPVQVAILPIGESHMHAAEEAHAALREAGIRSELRPESSPPGSSSATTRWPRVISPLSGATAQRMPHPPFPRSPGRFYSKTQNARRSCCAGRRFFYTEERCSLWRRDAVRRSVRPRRATRRGKTDSGRFHPIRTGRNGAIRRPCIFRQRPGEGAWL